MGVMDERITEIIEKVQKAKNDVRYNGIKFAEPLQELYNDLDYLLTVIHFKNERISKLEKIIVEDRINKLD